MDMEGLTHSITFTHLIHITETVGTTTLGTMVRQTTFKSWMHVAAPEQIITIV